MKRKAFGHFLADGRKRKNESENLPDGRFFAYDGWVRKAVKVNLRIIC